MPPLRAVSTAELALLPLRAFLGITFCFAGLQKLANPGFFDASNPASIQSQLAGAARRSPIHALLGPIGHAAVPLGLLIAFGELAVGLGTLVGLYARVAAAGGMLISLGLFLTVSFHSNPYYTGSDIVFLFAWMPLVLAGAGALSADAVLAKVARRAQGPDTDAEPAPLRRSDAADLERRTFVLKGAMAAVLGALGLIGGGVVAGIGRLAGGTSSRSSSTSLGAGAASPSTTRPAASPTTTAPPTTAASAGTAPPTTAAPASRPPGTRLGPASTVPVGGAASFTDPATGDPAWVVQPQRGVFRAFDATCPHAGCPVQYSSPDHAFICPCHGSQFNGSTGAVETGPAQSDLTRIAIAEGSDGQLYAK